MGHQSRRQVLGTVATGTALSLAGCSALDDDEPAPDALDDDGTAPDTDEAEGAATIAVEIDEEGIAEQQSEIEQQLEDEEISQEEAQAEFQALQLEALEEAVGAVESYAADVDGLEVLDSSAEVGALLVDGEAEAMIDALNEESVAALVPAAQFQAFQEQPVEGE